MTIETTNPSKIAAPVAQNNTFEALMEFTRMLLIASFRDRRNLMATLFAPVLLLVMFSFMGKHEDLLMMLPIIVGLAVIFSGASLATRLVSWRDQKIFQRLAVTPIPLGQIIVGILLVQLFIYLLQGMLVYGLGLVMARIPFDATKMLLVIATVFLGAGCFIAFGALISTIASKTEAATSLYTFILLPMVFLGGSIMPIPILGEVGRLFPTTMLTNLLQVITTNLSAQTIAVNMIGLLIYTLIFTFIVTKRFRWE